MLGNEHEASGESPGDNRLNCWQSLKPEGPQRGDETGPSVTVAKAEKILGMAYGASLRVARNGSSAAKPLTGERSTTIPRGSRDKRPEKVGSTGRWMKI